MSIELVQSLRRAAAIRPDHLAICEGQLRLTWADTLDRVARLSAAFRACGVDRGDRVAILASNSAAYFQSLFAIYGLGAVAVPLNTRLAVPELQFQLEDSGSEVLLIDQAFESVAERLRAGSVNRLIGFSKMVGTDDELEELIANHEPIELERSDRDDLAGIFYTGGTTGKPKGVMHSHGSLHAMATNLVLQLQLNEDCVVLHSAPMFHMADFAIYVVTQVAGTHVIIPSFDDGSLVEAIERYGVTHSFTVPAVINRIARSADLHQRDLSSLKVLGYGGAPMPWGDYLNARRQLPDIDFVQGFGMTEMPSISFLAARYHRQDADPIKLKSAGTAGNGYELRIIDENGEEVPRGTVGEIIGRGGNVMQGYWRREEETNAALRNGWMHSGDLGFMDEDGFITITDRLKDMIVTGGENVYSIEVENVLSTYPAVQECAIIGVPDREWGERVHACVVLAPGASLDREAVIAFCRNDLAGYKIPRSFSIVDGALPRNAAGKVLKTVLREQEMVRAQSQADERSG